MVVIAIDLGGTKLAGAVFRSNGTPYGKGSVELGGRRGRAVGRLILEEVGRLLRTARERGDEVAAVGVSVPGISHSHSGRVWAPNIPGWRSYPLRAEIESLLRPSERAGARRTVTRVPVVVDSDRACCILGETWRGAAKGSRNAIFLAVGTGIGAGILVDGQVLRGAHDVAGSIGWWALDRPFRREYVPCGCFEHHASGNGLAKVAAEMLGTAPESKWQADASALARSGALTAREVFRGWDLGDPLAKAVLGQAVEFWGMAVANLVSMFNPEVILFGGGVFGPATRLLSRIGREAKRWAQPVAIRQVKLRAAKLGGEAALFGAGRLALSAVSR